jgi:protease-4
MFVPSSELSFGERIGVIPVSGPIMDSQEIVSALVKFKKDKSIKAIILRINSPGGGVGPSQEIYREIRKTIRSKKVIASLGGVAASGGYYIAAGANKIVANPGSITGSIGVLMEFVRLEELFSKIGVNLEVLKSGEFKDIGSPHRKLTERDKKIIEELMGEIQQQFVEAIAKGRNLSVEQVQKIADGRIFSGAKAKELGLVDNIGNFQDAIDLAKKMVQIKGDAKLVFPRKSKTQLLDLLFESAAKSFIKRIKQMRTQIEYRWNGHFSNQINEKN